LGDQPILGSCLIYLDSDLNGSEDMVMNIITAFLPVETEGNGDVVDLTGEALDSIKTCGIKNGTATIFPHLLLAVSHPLSMNQAL
jgi:hypothetical protein